MLESFWYWLRTFKGRVPNACSASKSKSSYPLHVQSEALLCWPEGLLSFFFFSHGSFGASLAPFTQKLASKKGYLLYRSLRITQTCWVTVYYRTSIILLSLWQDWGGRWETGEEAYDKVQEHTGSFWMGLMDGDAEHCLQTLQCSVKRSTLECTVVHQPILRGPDLRCCWEFWAKCLSAKGFHYKRKFNVRNFLKFALALE
jgi:hypothetical protein